VSLHVGFHVALLPEAAMAHRAVVLLFAQVYGANVYVEVAAGRQVFAAQATLVALAAHMHGLDVHFQVVPVAEALAALIAAVRTYVAHFDVTVELELVRVGRPAYRARVRVAAAHAAAAVGSLRSPPLQFVR